LIADLFCGQESNENVVKKDFNLLLGSEGAQSIVRQIAGIEWTVQSTFDFVPFKLPHELVRTKQVRSISVNDLQQVSALVNFKPINGECPRLNQGIQKIITNFSSSNFIKYSTFDFFTHLAIRI
jgi:hypothetical protein